MKLLRNGVGDPIECRLWDTGTLRLHIAFHPDSIPRLVRVYDVFGKAVKQMLFASDGKADSS